MFQTIVEERKAREIDPTLSTLRECLSEVAESETETALLRERLSGLLDFFETMNACYKEASRLPASALAKYLKVSNKVRELLDVNSR